MWRKSYKCISNHQFLLKRIQGDNNVCLVKIGNLIPITGSQRHWLINGSVWGEL